MMKKRFKKIIKIFSLFGLCFLVGATCLTFNRSEVKVNADNDNATLRGFDGGVYNWEFDESVVFYKDVYLPKFLFDIFSAYDSDVSDNFTLDVTGISFYAGDYTNLYSGFHITYSKIARIFSINSYPYTLLSQNIVSGTFSTTGVVTFTSGSFDSLLFSYQSSDDDDTLLLNFLRNNLTRESTPVEIIQQLQTDLASLQADYNLLLEQYNTLNNDFDNAVSQATTTAYNNGYNAGNSSGYSEGYTAGYDEGFSGDSVATTIFSGILQIGLLPINFFLAIFNFEVLGINIGGVVCAILTICLTIIVIKTVTGKGGD